jgi:hypothetical protein
MDVYTHLFDSMIDCCDRIGFRPGLVYTVAMSALGVTLCLNLLSVLDLLWSFGVVADPYGRGTGALHPQHYVYGLLYAAFIGNTLLARIKFSVDYQCLRLMREPPPRSIPMPKSSLFRAPAPAYILVSAVLFGVTVTLDLLSRG